METKVVLTMDDAVKAYKASREEEIREEAEQNARIESETTEKLNKAGLVPARVERNVAFFEYKGEEIGFRIFDAYGTHWIQRIGKCSDCGLLIYSQNFGAQLANFGKLLVNPSWEHHFCTGKESAETPAERLIAALHDVLLDEQ